MKSFYWRIKVRPNAGAYVIEFWSKKDEGDALTFITTTTDSVKIFERISFITGLDDFNLTQAKGPRCYT